MDELMWLKDRLEFALSQDRLVDIEIEDDQSYGVPRALVVTLLGMINSELGVQLASREV